MGNGNEVIAVGARLIRRSLSAFQLAIPTRNSLVNRRSAGAIMSSAALIVGLSACSCGDDRTADKPSRSATLPEERDFVASFNDFAQPPNKFVAWWGPQTSTSCAVDVTVHRDAEAYSSVVAPTVDEPGAVTLDASAPRVLLEFGAEPCPYTVYLDGQFRGEPDPAFKLQTDPLIKAKWIPVWPIVYTNRIKVGATGTKFFVHVDGNRHTIGRLAGGTGTLYVNRIDNGVDTATILPSSTQDRYLVYVSEASPSDPMPEFGSPQTPAEGSPEKALFTEVRRRHMAHQGAYPPIPDNP